jgi:hypothetical protein
MASASCTSEHPRDSHQYLIAGYSEIEMIWLDPGLRFPGWSCMSRSSKIEGSRTATVAHNARAEIVGTLPRDVKPAAVHSQGGQHSVRRDPAVEGASPRTVPFRVGARVLVADQLNEDIAIVSPPS